MGIFYPKFSSKRAGGIFSTITYWSKRTILCLTYLFYFHPKMTSGQGCWTKSNCTASPILFQLCMCQLCIILYYWTTVMHYNWHIMVAMILIPNFKKYYTKNLQWASEFLTLQNFDYHSTWHCFPVLKFTKKYSSIWIVNWLHARYVQFLKKLYWTGVDPSRSELCIIICNLVEMYAFPLYLLGWIWS